MNPARNKKPSYGDESPIAAIATPRAISALAVIRLSGKGSIDLLAGVFSRPAALKAAGGGTVVYGWIVEGKQRIDEVLVPVYKSPKSFTGEDGADICCHGGFQAVNAVMDCLFNAGFREALPGEFSFRAFINGKIDISRAEAIMEIVSSKTDAGRSRAVRRLAGTLERQIRDIQNDLIAILAEVELNLDYSEMDGIEVDNAFLDGREKIEAALKKLDMLSAGFAGEKIYRDGVRIVLAGAPNAGKSSLFNLLAQEERSIVSAVPGTTRDWLEAWISLEGIPLCLIDTAGLRNISLETSPEGGEIEAAGIERSRTLIENAGLVLHIIDGERSGETGGECELQPPVSSLPPNKIIKVWNKTDLAPPTTVEYVPVSAVTGEGVAELCKIITRRICEIFGAGEAAFGGSSLESERTAFGNERQKKLADLARYHLNFALNLALKNEPLDIIAPELREAIHALGEITGDAAGADILNEIFSRFCVGK